MAIHDRCSALLFLSDRNRLCFVAWIILIIMVSSALLLQILGCAIYGSWWPMLTAVLYIFIPMPSIFFGTSSDFGDSSNMWTDCGKFLTGFSAVGLIAVPVSLFHAQYIKVGALILELCSAILLFISVMYYDYNASRDNFF